MNTMLSKGYTLWLMPKGKVYKKFADLIKKLGGEYEGPIFEPHVTLLGDIELPRGEIIRKTEQLVHGQKPFTVNLQQIDYQNFYFRTLFIRAEITQPLLDLHNLAKEIFKMDMPPYMPHLSLLYGTFPKELKEKIIKEIGKDQKAQLDIDRVYLVKGGEVEKWEIIEGFPFS